MKRYQRAHPIMIFFNLGRVLYLIIIPLLRGFVTALQGGFTKWLSGAWADISIFILMLAIAVTSWLIVGFRYDDEQIEVHSGLFFLRHTHIPWKNVTTLSVVESVYLRPFHAVRLRADTLGGNFSDSDFSILLPRRKAQHVLDSRNAQAGEPLGRTFQPTTGSIVALSLLSSNSFGGILFIATFISQSGKLLGREFSEMLIGTFEEASRNVAFGIPPAAAAIGYALLAGWFIGFLFTFFRYKNFTLTRKKDTLSINGGLFTNRDYFIRYSNINFIDIRQSVATKLFKLYSLYISAVGYGKQKDDISCIIPTANTAVFEESRARIFPRFSPSPRQHFAPPRGFMRFIGQPVSLLTGIIAAVVLFFFFFPSWNSFILFAGLMLMVPTLLFLCVRIIEFKTGGISVIDGIYTLRYSTGFILHTVVIPAEKLVKIELNQGFIQKFGAGCDLIINTKGEGRWYHRCRNLNMADMKRLFEL